MCEFRIIDQQDPRIEAVGQGLAMHNEAAVGPSDRQILAVLAETRDGALIGGLSGYTAWGWLYTQWLWVSPDHRGKGIAGSLLDRAEAEAGRRGCKGAHLDTFSSHALGLYQRQGYRTFGEIPDFVNGETRRFLTKRWG